jgi:hypothetical protein
MCLHKFIISFFIAIALVGCATTERKSEPSAKTKSIRNQIAGKVSCAGAEKSNKATARDTVVSLLENNKVLATAFADAAGVYKLTAPLGLNQIYRIEATGTCGKVSKEYSARKSNKVINQDLVLIAE